MFCCQFANLFWAKFASVLFKLLFESVSWMHVLNWQFQPHILIGLTSSVELMIMIMKFTSWLFDLVSASIFLCRLWFILFFKCLLWQLWNHFWYFDAWMIFSDGADSYLYCCWTFEYKFIWPKRLLCQLWNYIWCFDAWVIFSDRVPGLHQVEDWGTNLTLIGGSALWIWCKYKYKNKCKQCNIQCPYRHD